MTDQPVHATTVARFRPGSGWVGVMLTGPSGAGKSDLALRLISRGWRLVADDYTRVFASGGQLYGTAPTTIAGRIEARGVGIEDQPTLAQARLGLVVTLTADAVERLPEADFQTLRGIDLPRVRLRGFEASAVEKVTVLSRRL
ncbi:MAG: HPr kinase/phosphatase C-terminal domain-containing protein [Brevundimonas sp.]|uniref:HPr kinase/phosphorylase n=1 Tax=Brevundimonas sp. TaxID=1871086 RepID=UPI001A27FE00|nr:HPr kinase/phosphatase C-terminal domain-containing protein [Brevundimonas sp.]MBJ7447702.1 HPr kinase/phosphatase C-terminal domain-containing protein [Brevundimonas sp.]